MGKKIRLLVQSGNKLKAASFSLERIRGVVGGPQGSKVPPTFQLELADRAGRIRYQTCQGTTESLKGTFQAMGVRDDFLFFVQVRNELTNIRREPVQESAVYIPLIARIEAQPQPNKAKSIIRRHGAPLVLASERFNELGAVIVAQGYAAAVTTPHFALVDDQQLRPQPKPAKKRAASPNQPSLL